MQVFKDNFSKWTTLFFIGITIFAVAFANERFQADGAHYLLHVVQSENFRVEHQRYILIFSQFLPWAGVQLGLSLNTIIVLNSLNPVLWWLLLFLYASQFLRDRPAAVGIILTQVLGVLHIQFTPMYEIWYGVPLVILLYSHIRSNRTSRPVDLVLFLALFVTTLFAHPLLPIAAAFIIVYDIAERKRPNYRLLIPVAVVTAGWYITKKLMLTEYESGKLSLLGAEWNSAPDQLLHPGYHWGLFKYFITWYTIPVAIFMWTGVFLFLRKMKWQLFLLIAFFAGHILLVNFTHENMSVQSPYFERMYLPLIPIVLVPFLFTLCREMEMRQSFAIFALLLVIGWRIGRFIDIGKEYKHRSELAMQLIHTAQKMQGSKFVIHPDDFKSCFSWVDWSFPMETLIRSAASPPYQRVTIISEEDLAENDNREKLDADEFLFRRWEIMKDRDLNQKYFHLTAGKYTTLPAGCLQKP